jgi:hypothetical protein
MDLLELAEKLANRSADLVDLGGCRCDKSGHVRRDVGHLAGAMKTYVQIEKNKLDYQFAEQMGMVEEGWADYQNYLTGSRFAV